MIPGKWIFAGFVIGVNDGEKTTFELMLYELIAAVILLPSFFLLKNSPPTAPSAFANTDVCVPFKQ